MIERISTQKKTFSLYKIDKHALLQILAIVSLIVVAGYLRFYNLNQLGYGNHYYAAAVKSMLQSWHNFIFVAAEPGGSVSVDKPPVGLWMQTISAYFFGVNSFGLLLPQILAGIGSVLLVYSLVKRYFGMAAGWIAGLALAITPVVVATDRNNTIDSTLIFTLLLAAWAFIKATETRKLRFLLIGSALVGVGFNIKMMEAYLPVPAFLALYFLGARESMWRKFGKLALSVAMLLIVSFSWAVAVDFTPASFRPYVGSSGDNSELSLIIGYNGVNRLIGMARGGRSGMAQNIPNQNEQIQNNQSGISTIPSENPKSRPSGNIPTGTGQGSNRPSGNASQQRQGGGTPSNIGTAGALRLFQNPLSKETSWLLPFSLIGLLVIVVGSRMKWPLSTKHQAAVLWGGWLITGGIFFSVAKYYHEYYLITIGAPMAALVGIGCIEFWQLQKRRLWLGAILFILTAAGTAVFSNIDSQWIYYTNKLAAICLFGNDFRDDYYPNTKYLF